ncbi:acetate kinase [Microbulbifer hainanensis]|uniref:acetate kinase n=1 Tax=Microbulbifer hainanensis TaxID=2735675 RepID=UPI0029C04009|nr:acetate kinase [Microbulbifer hainanensis]
MLNAGSSSLKFAVVDPQTGAQPLSGIGESLGNNKPSVSWRYRDARGERALEAGAAHGAVLGFLVGELITNMAARDLQLVAVGHRVVHGGEYFSHSVLIDTSTVEAIEACSALAPLHNPAGLLGIRAATEAFPQLPQVAVFDTAFHQTLPDYAYLYALPHHLYSEHGIRRYGMHGTSYRFVCERAAKLIGRPLEEVNIIAAHLGNGASVAAIKGGISVDTSMGMTPMEGLVMGTRCGDVDPGILIHLAESLHYAPAEINRLLNRESGLLGISELSNDCRALVEAALDGHRGAELALALFCYRLAKYIAAYAVPLRRIDALVFTGGIGENSVYVRAKVLEWLGGFGYLLDEENNRRIRAGAEGRITRADSSLALVIPTNEEWIIARDALQLIESRE